MEDLEALLGPKALGDHVLESEMKELKTGASRGVRQGAGREQGESREGRGEGGWWSGSLELPGSPLPSPKGESQDKERGILLPAPNLLLGCRIPFWLSLGLPSPTGRAQKLPDLPGLCLLHGPRSGGRGVGVVGRGGGGGRKEAALTPQV